MTSLLLILILLAVLAWAAISGFRIGLFRQLGSLAGLVVAAMACHLFGARVAEAFIKPGASADEAVGTTLLVYVVFYLVVYFTVYFLGGVLRSLCRSLKLGPFDQALGSIFRVVVWLVLISLALNVACAFIPGLPLGASPLTAALLSLGRMVMGADPAAILHSVGVG